MNKTSLNIARELHAKGDLNGALKIYEDLLSENPINPELLHLLGILHAQLNKLDLALGYLNDAIKIESNPAFYNSLGNVQKRLNDYDAAISAYQKAIELKPDYPAAYNNLGLLQYQKKKFELAKNAYKKALEFSPHFIDALFNYALLEAEMGELDNAQSKLEKAFEQDPKNPKILGQLGQIHLNKGEYSKALVFFDEKLKSLPDDANTFYDIGVALLKNEQFEDAIKSFETALSKGVQDPELNHHLATAYLYLNESEKALNYYFRQLEIKPLFETYYNIGVILMNKNRNKEAIHYFEHANTLEKNYFPTYVNLGALYLKIQNLQKAIEQYEIATHLHPEDNEIQHILSALKKDRIPEAAPKEYLQHLFDQYSTYYETHLTQHLKYQVPEKMLYQIEEEIQAEKSLWQILDLGCGTGLCGILFKKHAKKLIGIDLSEKMLEIARSKNVYDQIQALDVTQALDQFKKNDLILAADVFTYIGNLEPIFEKAFQALKPNGFFSFSVEKTFEKPYELQHSIRYAHSKKYLEELIEKNNFKILRFDNLILRQQNKKNVEGYLVLLQK